MMMLALTLAAILGSWTAVGPAGQYANAVAADPVVPGRVYAGTGAGLFKSEDGGATWRLAGSRTACENVVGVAVDRVTPSIVYAGTSTSIECVLPEGDGLFRSSDFGETWVALETGHPAPLVRAVPGVAGRLYVSSIQSCFRVNGFFVDCVSRLLRSDDFGETLRGAFSGLPDSAASFLAVDPQRPLRLWATRGGVFRSDDGGDSWIRLARLDGIPGTPEIFAIEVDPRDGDTLLLSTSIGNFRSADGGSRWNPVTPLDLAPATQFLFGREGKEVYAVLNSDIYRSADDGISWTPFDTGLATVPIIFGLSEGASDGRGARRLYAATGRGVFAIDIGPAVVPGPRRTTGLVGRP